MKATQVGKGSQDINDSMLDKEFYSHGHVYINQKRYSVEDAKKSAPEKAHRILMRDSSKYAIEHALENDLFS